MAAERAAAAPQEILAIGELLAARGVFGLVWLDSDLAVTARYGALAETVAVGKPVTDSLPLLFSYAAEIALLRSEPGRILELPAVTMQLTDTPSPKLNLLLIHSRRSGLDVMLISRTSVGNDLELQLSQQIRDRLILEREARALASRLERANHDLEEFASIISHDLKAPMRAMRYLIDDADAALGSAAPPPARHALAQVREQAVRLNGMLSALFDYSRAGQKLDVAQPTDLGALADAVIRSMPQQPGIRIARTGDWPSIETLAAPLDLVLRNLIDNAIKHHDRRDIHVEVTAADRGSSIEIAVIDDGPGIDPRYHAAVLQPFRRLAQDDEASGSGMGLALVKRTIESVGGRLELVSDPSSARGTTFKVLWPRVLPA